LDKCKGGDLTENKICSTCCYSGYCSGGRLCSDYAPVADLQDDEIELLAEENWKNYYNEYAKYVSQYDDDLFFI
jgi:hypothetical protein